VDIGIGATLREARNRRKLELPQVEEAIKIRLRYLRAIENEDWDVLPGGAYTRAFIRTYAGYLGLDGERLADEYRRVTTPAGGERAPQRVEPVPSRARGGGPHLSGRLLVVLAVVGLVAAALVAIGLTGGNDGSSPSPTGAKRGKKAGKQKERTSVAAKPGAVVLLTATGEVWVCMLDDGEEPLVDGAILEAGEEAGPFRSRSFAIALGNGEAKLSINGKEVDTPPSSSPVGYGIDSSGKLTSLEEGERPSCE
jgi:cytoskeleton protein RodZ